MALISKFVAELGSDSQPFSTHLADIEYVPTELSVKLVPVELFDQSTVPVAQVAVKVKLLGEHTINWLGGVIVGTLGLALISKFVAGLASDSQPFKTHLAEMEYVPTVESVKLVLVELFDQRTVPVVQLAVKVREFGEQTTVLVGGVIVGTVGLAFTVSEFKDAVKPLSQVVLHEA